MFTGSSRSYSEKTYVRRKQGAEIYMYVEGGREIHKETQAEREQALVR